MLSRLAEAISGTLADLETSFLKAPIVGHVGDGNFHMLLLMDPSDPKDLSEATRLHDLMVARALSLGGTSTGEHGIGEGKIKFLETEHGAGVGVMRAIKQAFDPKGILNPGKIFSA